MKSTGIVRKVDDLGRIVVPIELRKTLKINLKDPLEIYVEGENVILKKHIPLCCFCSGSGDLKLINGKKICYECREEIKLTDFL